MLKSVPLIKIPLDNLELDDKNPRISKDGENSSQESILKEMFDNHSLKDLAVSMKSNGYLNVEPIIVIPRNLNIDLNNFSTELELKELLESKIKEGLKFIVLEGNRRISTAKLIINDELRKKLNIKSSSFELESEKLESFKFINSSCYFDRKDVSTFIGVRHINSNLKWSSYSKAKYIHRRISELMTEGLDMGDAIKQIESEIGDTTVMIKRFYLCYRITNEARDNFEFNITPITQNFSFLTTAINYSTFRSFIGLTQPISKIIFTPDQIIPNTHLTNFKRILTWIFGNLTEDKRPLIKESRDISYKLSPILASQKSTEYLIETSNLDEAFDYSDGEKKFIMTNFNVALTKLENIKKIIWKQNNEEDKKEFNFKLNELKKVILSIQNDLEND